MSLVVGDILVERYRIVSQLGRGRAGVTYRAWDMRDNRDVVIKAYYDATAETQRHFREDARRLSELTHPQLPAVLDHFAIDGVGQHLVTEYIDGVDLGTLARQFHPLPSDRIITWLQEITKPVAFLHSQKQLHLDIKPSNIRIDPRGKAWLVDSGLPRLGVPLGTPGYASPEQEKQIGADESSDIYALGASLYTAITNQVPISATKRDIGLNPMPSAREVNPDSEPYLSVVAARAMSPERGARYESVEGFGRALNRPAGTQPAIQRQPISSFEPDPALKRYRPRRQWRTMQLRTIVALAVLLGGLLAAGSAFGFFTFGQANEPDEATASLETATLEPTEVGQVALALTAVSPTEAPTPDPTLAPTAEPSSFTDEATGAVMQFVPSGLFRMGDDEGVDADMKPSHRVRLDAFFMDETEVTNSAYALCVEDGTCTPPQQSGATYHQSYFGDPKFDEYPVIFVDWSQANTFCAWREARLPSEAEWEYAAGFRAESAQKLKFPWGDTMVEPVANFCDLSCTLREERDQSFDDGHADTSPVKTYPDGVSPFGIYDMVGNVHEWVADWYSDETYTVEPKDNPLGPPTGSAKVIRGGSWYSLYDDLGVAVRGSYVPEVTRATLGFRCAMAAR